MTIYQIDMYLYVRIDVERTDEKTKKAPDAGRRREFTYIYYEIHTHRSPERWAGLRFP